MKRFKKALVYEFEGSHALSDMLKDMADEVVIITATQDYQHKIDATVMRGVECLVTDVFDEYKNEYFDLDTLKCVSVNFTSLSMFDIDFLSEHDIKVTNVTGHATPGVAQMMLSMLLNLTRNIPEALTYAKGGGESFTQFKGTEIASQTVAIFGLGSIGSYFADACSHFGAEIQYSSRSEKDSQYKSVPFSKLTKGATVLAVTVPTSDNTKGLFNKTLLEKLERNAVILCPGQFECFDVDDLYAYLSSNPDVKFWFDVEATEAWKINRERFLALDNFYVTPHSAFFTHEQPARALAQTKQNLQKYLQQ